MLISSLQCRVMKIAVSFVVGGIVIDLASSPQTHEEQMRKLRQAVTGEEWELMQCLMSEVNRVGDLFDRLHSLVCET